MVTYWCAWCGENDHRPTEDEVVPCGRCAREFARLFGFVPRTMMFPLRSGEEPGRPAASDRRFEFRDAETGALRGRTEVVPWPELGRASGE